MSISSWHLFRAHSLLLLGVMGVLGLLWGLFELMRPDTDRRVIPMRFLLLLPTILVCLIPAGWPWLFFFMAAVEEFRPLMLFILCHAMLIAFPLLLRRDRKKRRIRRRLWEQEARPWIEARSTVDQSMKPGTHFLPEENKPDFKTLVTFLKHRNINVRKEAALILTKTTGLHFGLDHSRWNQWLARRETGGHPQHLRRRPAAGVRAAAVEEPGSADRRGGEVALCITRPYKERAGGTGRRSEGV